ncbi:membrane integrity-associated transporter subunit PqiC (plasmid) [Falsihalocynthiibacter sp. SS001]|uniref:PqiC family protein n=1 Tax=Falsihalocynthiibacter sp. SS001 TaxID=3349698 RepID=UPI0036D3E1C1
MRLLAPFVCSLALLAACSSSVLYPVTTPPISGSVNTSVRSLEVRDVSLPSYAAAEEITIQNSDGSLSTAGSALWADIPVRAISLELSRNIAALTGARVASEPWPFETRPQARLEVRMDELLPGADGVYRGSGQYFVGSTEGGRDRAGSFALSVPFDPKGGPLAISRARGQLIQNLARKIATEAM